MSNDSQQRNRIRVCRYGQILGHASYERTDRENKEKMGFLLDFTLGNYVCAVSIKPTFG